MRIVQTPVTPGQTCVRLPLMADVSLTVDAAIGEPGAPFRTAVVDVQLHAIVMDGARIPGLYGYDAGTDTLVVTSDTRLVDWSEAVTALRGAA